MTTITHIGTSTPELSTSKRTVQIVKDDTLPRLKNVELTVGQKAELAQAKAISAATVAASQKQVREAQKILHPDSHEIYLSSITHLSLEGAQKSLGIAEVMAKNKEDVGFNVHGRYGNQEITDLKTYVTALKDYISKYPTAGALATASTPPAVEPVVDAGAASIYRQVQNMVTNDGVKS